MGDYEHLAGRPLPAGEFTVTAEEDRRLRRAIGEPEPAGDDGAHPLWAYVATQRGIDISVGDLCRLVDFDILDGPMLGSSELEYAGEVRLDVPYRVTGEVVGVERKQGRTLGAFDVLTYRERLVDPDGRAVAAATNTFILPRSAA
jgi:hypothetical protein